MKYGIHRKAVGVGAVLSLGLAGLLVFSLHVPVQLRKDVSDLDRVHEVQMQTQRIHITLLDLETSQRGYLLTQAAPYLEPYRAGLARLGPELERLSVPLADQPAPANDVLRLRRPIDAKRAELAATITLADTQGIDKGRALLRENRGKALMDDIRRTLATLESNESAAQARRDAARRDSIDRSERYTAWLATAIGGLSLTLFVLIRRDRAFRARLRTADEADRQDLERRVIERTAELEAASHALALGQARLQGIFDSATDAILIADAKQSILEANPAAARLFGCSLADLIGAPLERLIPARFHDLHRRDVETFWAGNESTRSMGIEREAVGLRADGEEFPIEAGISHHEVNGERLYTVILRDVTERQRVELALRESKTLLEVALGSMSDAVCICDASGRLLEFNDAFTAFYGFRSREACRRTLGEYPEILECFIADGSPAALEQWALPRALRGEVASNVEYSLRRRDTGQCWVGSYSFAPIRSNEGRIVGAVVSCRDITDVKKVQAELAASHARLQQLLANQHRIQEDERKRIARELHDDLQQSLAAIRMDAVAVGERLAGGRGDAQELLSRIDRLSAAAIASSRRIVSDLRPEMLEELGLVPALEVLCARHQERADAVCRLDVVPGTSDAQLDGSAIAIGLYRITQEALNNVAKHARATAVSVRLDHSHKGTVLLRVSDNGIGLDPHDKGRPGRFGLHGMSERVRDLGGQLRIEGRAHRGTTIEVQVPTWGAVAGAAPTAAFAATAEPETPGSEPPWPDPGPVQQSGELGHSLQVVIDALAVNVAVLDRQGEIQCVNQAWREFVPRGGDTGLQGCGPGTDYLAVCRRNAATDPATGTILEGLNAVLTGHHAALSMEYCCDTSEGRHRFRMNAALITSHLVIVTHIDLTPRGDALGDPAGTQATVDGLSNAAPG